jgi:hypothetical protein
MYQKYTYRFCQYDNLEGRNSIEQNPTWETNSSLASQDIPRT